MGIAALVFDFDGLLMDTESTQLNSWQYEWRQHGLELDVSTFFADHGGDVSEIRYAALAAAVGDGYDRVASHIRRIEYRDSLNAKLELRPGIREWLDSADGFRLAIASSSPTAWVVPLLEKSGYRSRFEVVACGDEVGAPKPDPAVYRLALRRMEISADQAVAFEDTPHGVAAAKAAGLRCVAIPNPHIDPARLTAADLVLASAADMSLAEIVSS
ncbi:HAD family hydrolase [Kibdelosporangium phytohabitans]|uniref:Phosphatase n=1 Tax=Kibdelosporangium phytohabitans TaxID=860235 RepID=A0A0N9IDG9_9PSEU|nr:HAD-IA family hydrolase [Kibdelosporangium phytohabitans]ALG13101.1 phosphatase [Kibdelosporangium phytohabitans]MBE1464842.1 putative hydrolase of the HAD superfamily [Kibdelosporangium phytohabitans]